MRARLALALVLVLTALPAMAQAPAHKMERVYIGTFTATPGRNPQTGNLADGIYTAELDTATGKLTTPRLVAKTASPSWLVMDRIRGLLYSVNEYNGFTDPRTGARSGSLSAFRIDRASGDLTPINQQAVADSTNLGLHPSGKWLIAASYNNGAATLLPVADDGSIGEVADVFKPQSTKGPDQAADQPAGNQSTSNHDHSRLHCVAFHPGGKYFVMDDAGQDTITVFTLEGGKINKIASYPQTPGSSPRHSVWDARGRILYTIFEQDVKVVVHSFDPVTGTLTERQTISAVPPGFGGSVSAAEVVLSKDGRNLYTSNREHDSIAHFAVKADGMLKYVSDTPTGTSMPRGLNIDLTGHYILAGGQNNDSIASFRLDPKTGEPKATGNYAPVLSPASFVFLEE